MIDQLWFRGLTLLSIFVGLNNGPMLAAPLLLTEIYFDTPGRDADQEWIEVANLGPAIIDLSDYKLSDEESSGGQEGAWRFPAGAVIEPAQAIIIAQKATGFRVLFGRNPDYEINDTDSAVPDMRPYRLWALGELALANDGDEVLLLDGRNVIRDAVNYGDSITYFAPAVHGVLTGQSIERMPAGCDSDTAADWLPQPWPSPGQLSFEGECRVPLNPAESEPLPPIGQIQGNGPVSPYVNQMVDFRGVVTGAYEDRNAQGIVFYTLFMQDLPGYEDGDAATSDGIAVFLGRQRPTFRPGDQLKVTGLVTEFFGFTEIDDDELLLHREDSGLELPVAVTIDPPAANKAQAVYLEAFESMLVTLDGIVQVAGPTHVGCGFEVIARSTGPRRVLRQNIDDPVGQIVPILSDSDSRCDDFPQVKSGDLVSGIAGPLIYSFDQFKITQQEVASLLLSPAVWPELPAATLLDDGQFSIATYNLGSHFDAVDDTGDEAEPVPSSAEVAIKQQKLAYAIHQLLGCPTFVAIQEVENAGLLLELAAAAGEACGFVYDASHRESPDLRGIDLALLSDLRRVRVQEVQLRQNCTRIDTGIVDETLGCAPGFDPLFSRPPLEVRLELIGRPYIFLVNHFKSKRGGEMETAAQRLGQATYVNELVNAYLAQGETAKIVVLGDFNDYELSPAMQKLTGGESQLTSPLRQLPDEERYSYIFGGASQLLDGILLSPQLAGQVVRATIFHVNADYPVAMASDATATGLPYRSSDHDLPLIVLAVEASQSPTPQPVIAPAETEESSNNPIAPTKPAASADGRIGQGALSATLILLGIAVVVGLVRIIRPGKRSAKKKS